MVFTVLEFSIAEIQILFFIDLIDEPFLSVSIPKNFLIEFF